MPSVAAGDSFSSEKSLAIQLVMGSQSDIMLTDVAKAD
jgi:hypothetical protein